MIRQGEIYLVDFGKKRHSELGKIRPSVVLQNDLFNRGLEDKLFRSVIVIPLTTDDILTQYKIPVPKRDKLSKKSYIITTWVCSVDIDRFDLETGVLTRLDKEEMKQLKERFCEMV